MIGEILSAYEFFDRPSLEITLKHTPSIRDPFTGPESPFYVLIETSGSNKDHDDSKLYAFLEKVMDDGVVSDGVLAQDSTQAGMFWEIREGISDACKSEGIF
jgi:FAD/FMN-containing dehydrogenase